MGQTHLTHSFGAPAENRLGIVRNTSVIPPRHSCWEDVVMSPPEDARAEACAAAIWESWTTGTRRAALPEPIRPTTPDAGRRAQRALAERAGRSYGWKLAATSHAGQAHIRVDGPLAGPLFERFRYEPGAALPSHDL